MRQPKASRRWGRPVPGVAERKRLEGRFRFVRAVLETLEKRRLLSANNIIDLGTLGGSSSAAAAINGVGDVVGTSTLPGDAQTHAVLWAEGRAPQGLGTLASDGAAGNSQATGPNTVFREVVGNADNPQNSSTDAFVWDSATGLEDLSLDASNQQVQTANAINDAGVIVGDASFTSTGTTVLSYTDGYAWDRQAGTFVELGSSDRIQQGGQEKFVALSGDMGVGTRTDAQSITYATFADITQTQI